MTSNVTSALHHRKLKGDFKTPLFFVCLTSINNEMKYVKHIIWAAAGGGCEQHRRRLISAFVNRFSESIISKLAQSKISIL